MDNRNDDQELNLDDILSEFQDNGEDTSFSLEDLGDALTEEPAAPQEPEADDLGDLSALIGEEPENPEELGWRMNEADKKPEDFNSFDEYREYLNEKYPFDKDAFDAQTDEQKAACRYVGMAGTMQELKGSKGFEINAASLGAPAGMASTLGWSNDTMKTFAQGMLNTLGGPGFNMLADYARGNLGAEDMSKVEKGVDNGLSEAGVSDSRDGFVNAAESSIQEQ